MRRPHPYDLHHAPSPPACAAQFAALVKPLHDNSVAALRAAFDQFDLDLTLAGTLASSYGLMNLYARSLGGYASDVASSKFGMRGRLWCLWLVQTLEGILCIFMALAKDSLGTTILCMVLFSIAVQASEGASYGIVPYITRRALGVASGYIGAGGNAGSTICMAAFFTSASIETYDGIMYMGFTIIAVTLLVVPIHFPMWGSMLFPGNPNVKEARDKVSPAPRGEGTSPGGNEHSAVDERHEELGNTSAEVAPSSSSGVSDSH